LPKERDAHSRALSSAVSLVMRMRPLVRIVVSAASRRVVVSRRWRAGRPSRSGRYHWRGGGPKKLVVVGNLADIVEVFGEQCGSVCRL
jgi:hypothetical protein